MRASSLTYPVLAEPGFEHLIAAIGVGKLSELSDELAGQAEELQQLVAIADARLTALRRATDR